jgi:hypothetical protein
MPTTTTTTSPRTALYARVSTTGHGQDVGLQLDELRQVARQRGWNVVAEHVDDGVSGATTSRPALDRLMDTARRGHLDLVVVWKLDRYTYQPLGIDNLFDNLRRTLPAGTLTELSQIPERAPAGAEPAAAASPRASRIAVR